MRLELRRVELPLSSFVLQVDVELNAARTAIFGPSGAGKTSLLETIAGLRRPATGLVRFDGIIFDDAERGFHLAVQRRKIGYVPQDDTLFPQFSGRRNLLYGWKQREAAETFSVDHVAQFLQIEKLLERDVRSLSRGEKQRLTIARALLSAPKLLLLDEPLTGIDSQLKAAILEQLAGIYPEFGVPILYVTHDRSEAVAICDEVIILEAGEIVARGVPRDLLAESETRFPVQ
ncbi:MAG: ATP-binding cassette domain-containing protein [Chthoniobacterales bacterium]